jgi:hypothetical protein
VDKLLEDEIAKRFGILPNIFAFPPAIRQLPQTFGDSPNRISGQPAAVSVQGAALRLLWRFCQIRYCIARMSVSEPGWAIRQAIPLACRRSSNLFCRAAASPSAWGRPAAALRCMPDC